MTSERKLYLKQNVVVEPLFNQWYAWSYLISPVTSAMFINNLHLKIMQSFIDNPQVHISALKNPAMAGGPFINYEISRISEIKDLMEKTIKEQSHMLALAKAVNTLDTMLNNEAQGYSIEPIYQKIPDNLKGYVELVYDLNNNPSIRFIEGLLYKSKYYNQSSQSIALSIIEKDKRPFIFSTPVLKDSNKLQLNIPFNYKGLDELFKMKNTPYPVSSIKEILNLDNDDKDLFSSFFTEEAPQVPPKYTGDAVRIRYFGHACILIEVNNISILCDPVISYNYKNEIPRYTYVDLPDKIDYALITHNHQDHFMFETLLQLRHKIKNLVVPKNNGGELADPSFKLVSQNIGFNNIIEIDEIETINDDDLSITGLPFFGEHGDVNVKSKIAYLINAKGKSILCAADSNNIEPKLYEHIHKLFGNIDIIFLGMECDGAPMSWLFSPLLNKPLSRKMDQSRRFDGSNYEKAIDIVNRFNPKQVYVYAMGQEPWLTYLTSIAYTEQSSPIIESQKLIDECKRQGIVTERLFGCKEIFLDSLS